MNRPILGAMPASDIFLVTSGALNMPTAEFYGPTQNASVAFPGPMNSNRQYQSATLFQDGTILIAGDRDNLGNDLASAEIYDPSSNSFSGRPARAASTIRRRHSAGYGGGVFDIALLLVSRPTHFTKPGQLQS